MSQGNKPDLNFKMEEIRRALFETLDKDNMSFRAQRDFMRYVLAYRRMRINKEYDAELKSYNYLYGHYQEGDKVPTKVNNKINKLNRMTRRLDKLIETEREADYIDYSLYYPAIKEKLEKALL